MIAGIMQPYFLPYLGYWQLMNAVDTYVVYDDVNYIKRGWINRNRILINGQASYINIPLLKASQNKLINEIFLNDDRSMMKKSIKSIEMVYKKAPYFKDAFPVIQSILCDIDENNVALFLMKSFIPICQYLDIKTEFIFSSSLNKNNFLKGESKIIEICKILGASDYYNAVGGRELYHKSMFEKENISLYFLKPNEVRYQQFYNEFVPNLSIIDVLMFNPKNRVIDMLNEYTLL